MSATEKLSGAKRLPWGRLLSGGSNLSLVAILVMFALLYHTTYQRKYYCTYMTYANDEAFGFKHDGTCRILLGNGQISAIRRYDDQTWLHEGEASSAQRGWRWGWVSAISWPQRFPRTDPHIWFTINSRGWTFECPLWLLIVVAAILPTIRLYRVISVARAIHLGRCSHCGYDLRASKDRCPECGAAIPTSASEPSSPDSPG